MAPEIKSEEQGSPLTLAHPGARPYLPGSSLCPRLMSADAPPRGVGGWVSEDADDFHVHELPKYRPEGAGEHAMALILKVGCTTDEAISALAEGSGLALRDLSFAGRKDKHAVTTQWISALSDPERLASADPRVTVLWSAAHRHKVKLGHLNGNLFSVRVSGMTEPEALAEGLERLKRGIPNYFERQRFGRARYVRRPEPGYEPQLDALGLPIQDPDNLATDNIDTALRILANPRRRKLKGYEKLALSALQSALFNLWLGERSRDGLMGQVVHGDVCRKVEGGTFYSTEPSVDTARLNRGEIEVMGPMIGPKLFPARDAALAREEALYARWGVTREVREGLAKAWRGDRRAALLRPRSLSSQVERSETHGVCARLSFILPSGSFATALLGDLIEPAGPPFQREARRGAPRASEG